MLRPDQLDPAVTEPHRQGRGALLDPASGWTGLGPRCPGTWASRWSMGVAAMNPVIRWRSMRSRTKGALKRSNRTMGSPPSRVRKAVNPLVW